jgi:hypothetical protein
MDSRLLSDLIDTFELIGLPEAEITLETIIKCPTCEKESKLDDCGYGISTGCEWGCEHHLFELFECSHGFYDGGEFEVRNEKEQPKKEN